MKVTFLGEITKQGGTGGGCGRCGTGRSVSQNEVYKNSHRTYYQNRLYVFNKGESVEVDDILGRYLLRRTYLDTDGKHKNSFVESADVT